jgi:hypothetical protein
MSGLTGWRDVKLGHFYPEKFFNNGTQGCSFVFNPNYPHEFQVL